MGGLSNFQGVTDYFPDKGYQVIVPMLPIYDLPLLKTNVKEFANYVNQFISHLNLSEVTLLGNSLPGTYRTAGFFVISQKYQRTYHYRKFWSL